MKRRLIMTLIAAVAVGCLIFAFSAPKQDDPNRPGPIEAVFPTPGNLELRQVAVVADLAPGYTGYLSIDGAEVPEDQTQFVDALNTVSLKPNPGSDFGTFQPGPHCATVFYRRIGDPREDSASYRWCFRLS